MRLCRDMRPTRGRGAEQSGRPLVYADPRGRQLGIRPLVVPHRARDPPAGTVPVEHEVVDATPQQRPVGRVPGLIDAADLGYVAEPLDAGADLGLVESLGD